MLSVPELWKLMGSRKEDSPVTTTAAAVSPDKHTAATWADPDHPHNGCLSPSTKEQFLCDLKVSFFFCSKENTQQMCISLLAMSKCTELLMWHTKYTPVWFDEPVLCLTFLPQIQANIFVQLYPAMPQERMGNCINVNLNNKHMYSLNFAW